MRQVWSVFKPPLPFDPYHPTFRVQALFLCWYVKNEVAESQIGSWFPLDRHATTNFGHYVGLEHWNAEHWTAWFILGRQGTLDEHKVKSLVPTFTFTPSTQLLHALAYHKARMALVYFQSSHGPHKIQSDKELDIQVWLTPPSFSLLLPADCLNTRFLGVPRLCAVSNHPLYNCTSSFTSTWMIRCEGVVPPSLGLTAVSSDIRHLSSSHCKAASSLSWEYTWKNLFFFAGCRQLLLQLLFSRDCPHYRHCVSNISLALGDTFWKFIFSLNRA